MSPSLIPGYYREERPWGGFERLTENQVSTVKILFVSPGKRLSLQKHAKREEFWRVIEGSGTIQQNDEVKDVTVGDEAYIPVGMLHRLSGGPAGIKVLEITTGEHDENDIERVEDDFGRS